MAQDFFSSRISPEKLPAGEEQEPNYAAYSAYLLTSGGKESHEDLDGNPAPCCDANIERLF
jgi:hypothetical protein